MNVNIESLISELSFKSIRSSGSGGQHVNKVSSKVELTFNLISSLTLNVEQKNRLQEKLSNRLTKDNIIIMQCDESRSQHKNKEIVIKRFIELIKDGLRIPKKRIPTKTPKAVIKKRLKDKRSQAERKANRKKPDLE